MNPFYNKKESRPRALVRLVVFIFLSILILGITASASLLGFEYLISGGLIFALFWMMFRFVDQRVNLSGAGVIVNKAWWVEFLAGSLIAAFAMVCVFLVEWISGDLEIEGFAWNRVSTTFWLVPVSGYLVKMLCVGFYEEILSRSYLIPNIKEGITFGNLNPRSATFIAVFISSVIFGIGHLFNPEVSLFPLINITGAGIMLALPFILTGKLSYSVGIHFAWNYVQGGVFGFPVSGTETIQSILFIHQGGGELWTGGNFGPEGGIIGLLAMVLIVALLLVFIKKREGKLELHPIFRNTFLENQQRLRKADELA